jgi:hypothetical protein
MDKLVEQREYQRKLLAPIHVSDIQVADRGVCLARYGTIVNASATGLLIHVDPQNLNPEILQHNLPLESVEGDYVTMKIVEMELEMDGTVMRARHLDQRLCELAIDFSDNAPAYWRECLAELLPGLDESE